MPVRTPIALRLICAAVLAGGLLAGCGGSRPTAVATDGSPVVARWAGDALSLADFEAAFAGSEGAATDTASAARRRDFLERYVNFRLKVLAARAAGYDRDSAYRAEVAEYRDQLAGPYFTDREVLDAIVRDLYDKQAEQVEVGHILIRVGEFAPAPDTLVAYRRATAIRDSIRAGQLSFETAARRHSQDPSAAQNGGALGWITGGQTLLDFENAAYRGTPGQVSEHLARTLFGYHIVHVTGRRPAPGEIAARHILLRPAGATPADTAAARAQIERIRARALAGEDFAALAREFSQDPGSGPNGGDLGRFGRGRMVAPFEEAAFALQNVGDVSPPVQSAFGIHLIQLTGTVDRPSLEEQFDELRQLAQRLPQTAIKRRTLGREFREQTGGRFDAAVVREGLTALGPADSVFARVTRDGFAPADARRVFAVVGDSSLTLSRLPAVFRRTRVAENPVETLARVAQDYVDERSVEAAIAGLETRDPEFARVFRSYADGVLYFRAAEDSVWTRAREDVVGLRAFHDARSGQYRWPERRRVLAFRTPADSLLRAVAAELDAGAAPAAVFARHEGGRFALRLDTVFVSEPTQSALDRVLELTPGQNTGVVAERSRLAVYVYDGLEPAREKTFAEARAELVSGYQDEIERAWERRLRARYRAETFPERVPPTSPPRPPAALPGRATTAAR